MELTREQELTLQQLKGASVKRALRQIVTSPGYAQLPDERKIVVLEAAIDVLNEPSPEWRVQDLLPVSDEFCRVIRHLATQEGSRRPARGDRLEVEASGGAFY